MAQIDAALDWDAIASKRAEDIESGRDLSYRTVLVPTLLQLSGRPCGSRVLDVGCGSGFVSRLYARMACEVVGIDPSAESIRIARTLTTGTIKNLTFIHSDLEGYLAGSPDLCDLVLANMTTPCVADLDSFLGLVASVLRVDGRFVMTTIHPTFWPVYCGYAHQEWFSYFEEIAVSMQFGISLRPDYGHATTHIHRPLHRYIQALTSVGLTVDALAEPRPEATAEALYPVPWKYPRFLALSCRKSSMRAGLSAGAS